MIAQKRLTRQRKKLEQQLCYHFSRSGTGAVTATTDTDATSGRISADEPNGPEMQQQYQTLFGMCHTKVTAVVLRVFVCVSLSSVCVPVRVYLRLSERGQAEPEPNE